MRKFKVDGIVADYKTDKWISKTAIYEAASESEALKKFRYDYKVKDGVTPKVTTANSCASSNPVVQNAMMARNGVKFDNPNYKAEDGIPFLDSHFDMFDKKVAKAMIEDAKKKGVRIPDSLVKKAREAVILKNAVAANAIKACNRVDPKNIEKVFSSQAPELVKRINNEFKRAGFNIEYKMSSSPRVYFSDGYYINISSTGDWDDSARLFNLRLGNRNPPFGYKDLIFRVNSGSCIYLSKTWRPESHRGAVNSVAKNAVDPLYALNSAETKMREAIGELGKVTDPDLRPLASRIATKLKAVQGELRRELAV